MNVRNGSNPDIGTVTGRRYAFGMARIRQTFQNKADIPIYVSVEPWPECFELEPGDRLTLVGNADEAGDAGQVDFASESEFAVWPNGDLKDIQFLLNGEPAEGRSWKFRHR